MKDFSTLASRIEERKSYPINRVVLTEVLQEQNIDNTPLAHQYIQHILKPETFTVCTGQQLGFAGGPLFVIYKALSVIYLAKKLKEENPTYNIIPIFWMASEDHDWAEVNHFYSDFQTRHVFPATFEGPVGRFCIPDYVESNLPPEWKHFWKPGQTWAKAFRSWLESLFGEWGLVILDADDKRLKKEANHLWKRELEEQFSDVFIQQENQKITQAGGKIQLHTREINLFVMDNNHRIRIEKTPFAAPETASNELKELSQLPKIDIGWLAFPEMISPNAALRPVYQEMILPNLAYVAGNAEIAYWKQLRGVFEAMRVFLPTLVPRASGKILFKEDADYLKEKGLSKDFIFQSLPNIRKQIVAHYSLHLTFPEWETIAQSLNAIEYTLQSAYPELQISIQSIRKTLESRKKQLEKKIISQTLNKYPQYFKPILAMKYRVEPDGMVQERILSALALGKTVSEIKKHIYTIYQEIERQGLIPFLIILE